MFTSRFSLRSDRRHLAAVQCTVKRTLKKKEFIEIQGVINVQNSIVGGSYQFSALQVLCALFGRFCPKGTAQMGILDGNQITGTKLKCAAHPRVNIHGL
jgi:hypothetical protein